MKKLPLTLFFVATIVLLVSLGYVLVSEPMVSRPSDMRYMDARLSIEDRAEILLSVMTLDEKIGQMALVEKGSITDMKDVSIYGIGAILSGGGGKPEENTPEGWKKMVLGFDTASRASRTGIPTLYGIDAVHGHANVPGATIFPHAIGLGVSRDPELVRKVAEATTEEVKATGISWVYSPNLDAPEDMRWGRVYEGFSSDPVLNGELGAAYVRGVQGDATSSVTMLATAKHYLGAGGMTWGSSSGATYKIDQGTTPEDEIKLRTSYLPPFKAAVDAGVWSVMAGLSSYGDIKVSANKYLLTDVLKEELGFQGFVVSDWYGVYEIPGGPYDNAITGINAGVDMLMLPYDYKAFILNVHRAVQTGAISEARIDDAVRRILHAKFAAGLFDAVPGGDLKVIGSAAHRSLAREAVSKSVVIKKDTSGVLSILSSAKKILVAGSAADNEGIQSGGWTIEWQGVDGEVPGATSLLEGMKQVAPTSTDILYSLRGEFASSTSADIGIAFVGEKPYAEGVGDNENPELTSEDRVAISALQKICKKVIVVIVSGRILNLPEESAGWDAIVYAWLPGSEGAGVADALFGAR